MSISATVAQLINAAARTAGILETGETAPASEMQDSLLLLNQIMEQFTIKGLLVYANDRLTFPLISNQQSYTIGTGGDFNTDRPFKIYSAGIINNTLEYPIAILTTPQEWQQVNVSNTSLIINSAVSYYLFIAGAFPLNTLYLYPTPQTVPATLVLYIQSPLSNFANVFETVNFPDGYFEALVYSLAEKICIENGNPVSNDIKRQKQSSINNLISFNAPAPVLQSPLINGVTNRRGWWL